MNGFLGFYNGVKLQSVSFKLRHMIIILNRGHIDLAMTLCLGLKVVQFNCLILKTVFSVLFLTLL